MGGGPYYNYLGGSRICTIAGVDQSGSDDANVTDWSASDFIVAVNVNSSNKDTEAGSFLLKVRDVTDEGTFLAMQATGEINWSVVDTNWSDGDTVATGDFVCTSIESTQIAGERNKGDNLTDSIDLAANQGTELWFGLNCDDAEASHEYEFELWDATNAVQEGTVGATITMAAAGAPSIDVYDNVSVDQALD